MKKLAQSPGVITTPQFQHQEHTQIIAQNLQQAGYPVPPQQVAPVTAETPIQKTPELQSVGADITGEDMAHIVGSTVEELTVGTKHSRLAKPGKFLNMLVSKLRRKKRPEQEIVAVDK